MMEGGGRVTEKPDLMSVTDQTKPSVSSWPPPSDAKAPSLQNLHKIIRPILVILPASGLALGFGMRLTGSATWSEMVWAAATAPVLAAFSLRSL